MKAIIKAAAVVGIALVFPVVALAATNIQNLTMGGQPNTTLNANESTDAVVWIDNTGMGDVESVSYEFPGTGLPRACVDVPDVIQPQFTSYSLPDFTAPTYSGTWNVKISAFGASGTATNETCQGSPSDTMTFNQVLTVPVTGVINNTTNSTTSMNQPPNWFQAWLASWNTSHPTTGTGGSTATNPKCDLIKPFLGATPFAYSPTGIQLQSALLLDNPYSIPALAAGSTVQQGYFGTQTHAALAAYNATYHCN